MHMINRIHSQLSLSNLYYVNQENQAVLIQGRDPVNKLRMKTSNIKPKL